MEEELEFRDVDLIITLRSSQTKHDTLRDLLQVVMTSVSEYSKGQIKLIEQESVLKRTHQKILLSFIWTFESDL